MSNAQHREQRLRLQAELQSLYNNLANFRAQEASYISASANIPSLVVTQVNEIRRDIQRVAENLAELDPSARQPRGAESYWVGFDADLAGELSQAERHYRSALRGNYPDASAALNSVRHRLRHANNKGQTVVTPISPPSLRSRGMVIALISFLLVIPLSLMVYLWQSNLSSTEEQASSETRLTPTPTNVTVIEINPDTPTAVPTNTPTPTSTSTNTPIPTAVPATPTPDETTTPSPTPTRKLDPAPQIIGPKNGLVWEDGSIVFEFVDQDIAYHELYCISSMRGYDLEGRENWSHEPIGKPEPSIPMEAHIFRIAKLQGVHCLVWTAAIGENSCDTIISQNTPQRKIGLPGSCNLP